MLIFIIVLLLSSCKSDFNDMSQFLKWANMPENNLVKEKIINGYKLKMKYLPPEYLVSQELSYNTNSSQSEIDSIYSYYSNSRTFLLSITHPAGNGTNPDVLISSSSSYSNYAEKYLSLSFGLHSFIFMNGEIAKYQPILAIMEQTTTVNTGRTFYLVFANTNEADDLLNEQVLDIVFDDDIFNTGISHFRFFKNDIDNIPEFKFLNITKQL